MNLLMSRLPYRRGALLAGVLLAAAELAAAPIPKLYSTGVKDDGTLLGNAERDTHYLLVESADAAFPGPNLFTLVPGFPVGPWMAEGPSSRWIAPRPQQGTGNNEGQYIMRTTFDLTGFDPGKAKISGKWAVDNSGTDIVLNGVSLGLVNTTGFGGFTDFAIESGFVEGTNTIDFVMANAPSGVNPMGLRVELRGTVELPDEPPTVLDHPRGVTVVEGEPITLTTSGDGTPPLTYQWKRNGTPINGATEATYTIEAAAAANEGTYTVEIKNGVGSKTSNPAEVLVFARIPGLFATGVDENGALLFDGSSDMHFRLVTNPDGEPMDPVLQDTTVFPIVTGPWLLPNDQSAWIGPRVETSAAAGGDYVYRVTIDLTGLDASTAFIAGQWASDNEGTLLLNGATTGIRNTAGFGTFSAFRVESGFLSGTNTLDFRINNAGAGYTGLRVQGLRGGARKQSGPAVQVPRIVTAPTGGTWLVGETLTLRVVADSTVPMTYQWSKDGQALTGKTESTLSIAPVALGDSGSYVVNVRNSAGNTNVPAAVVRVLERVPGVFNTGVGPDGVVLEDGVGDAYYAFTTNANDLTVSVPVVHNSTIFPIVTGPWLANSATSKWIGPELNTVASLAGNYAYVTAFDLAGFDPTTAVLLGGWATDNDGLDIRLNGASTGLMNTAQFAVLTPFTVTSGFVPGLNKLEFIVSNAAAGYTALRVDGLRVGAMRATAAPALKIEATASGVRVSWPAASTGFGLRSAPTIGGSWTEVNAPVIEVNGQNTVNLGATAETLFFRLQK